MRSNPSNTGADHACARGCHRNAAQQALSARHDGGSMSTRTRASMAHRRGAAVVAMVVAMLVATLGILGMVLAGSRDQALSIPRLETIRAFYAAEAGANMSIREILLNVDSDGDSGVGTVS